MAFAKCAPMTLWFLFVFVHVASLRNEAYNFASSADRPDNFARASSAMDEFMNASLENQLANCVIASPTTERQLKLGIVLGSGVEGTVYKAKDAQGRYAAVKIFKPGKLLQPKELANLRKLSAVRSKHLNNLELGFEDVRTCCNRPCVVTEFIQGKDAAKILWENGIFSMKDVRAGKAHKGALSYKLLRSILLQSLAAFNDTESAGLCNEDQNLRNVMFEEATERIVFIDFGLAISSRLCLPVEPFEPDQVYALQSFRSLGYLLKDEGDQQAYLGLCDRITSMRYKSAKVLYKSARELLMREAFSTSPPSADSPGVFFGRHKDDVITRQLNALLKTGSPHIGKVSGVGPWYDSNEEPSQPSG